LEIFEIDNKYFIPAKDLKIDYIYNENGFEFNSETLGLPDNCAINGYFQTEKYFNKKRNLILSQFTFKEKYLNDAISFISKIKAANKDCQLVSIHVRRGDYLTCPDYHPTCSDEYYKKSQEYIKKYHKNIRFLIFSDDIDWCRTRFKGREYIIIDIKNHYSEMCIMTLCDHNIIANSSFSWWGAWLNKNDKKIVTAPSNWFGPAMNKDHSNVYCKKWKKIKG
jgi:hypothetical protein